MTDNFLFILHLLQNNANFLIYQSHIESRKLHKKYENNIKMYWEGSSSCHKVETFRIEIDNV